MHLVDTFGKPNLEVLEQILALNQRDFGQTFLTSVFPPRLKRNFRPQMSLEDASNLY